MGQNGALLLLEDIKIEGKLIFCKWKPSLQQLLVYEVKTFSFIYHHLKRSKHQKNKDQTDKDLIWFNEI